MCKYCDELIANTVHQYAFDRLSSFVHQNGHTLLQSSFVTTFLPDGAHTYVVRFYGRPLDSDRMWLTPIERCPACHVDLMAKFDEALVNFRKRKPILRKKLGDFTLREIKAVCANRKACEGCPFSSEIVGSTTAYYCYIGDVLETAGKIADLEEELEAEFEVEA